MVWARFISWQWNNFSSLPFFLHEFFFFPCQCMVLLFCSSSSSSLVSFTLIPYGPRISWQPVLKEPNQGPTRQSHTIFNTVFPSTEISPCYRISKLVLKKIIRLWTIQKLLIWAKVKKITKKADHCKGNKVVGAKPEPDNCITLVRFENICVRLYSTECKTCAKKFSCVYLCDFHCPVNYARGQHYLPWPRENPFCSGVEWISCNSVRHHLLKTEFHHLFNLNEGFLV